MSPKSSSKREKIKSEDKSKDNKNFFLKANQFLSRYKILIELVGALVAIIVLIATFWGVRVNRDFLEFTKKEFYATNTPTWKFEVDSEKNIIRIVSTNSDFIIQNAQVIYPDESLNIPIVNDVSPPLHEWHVSLLKKYLQNEEAILLNASVEQHAPLTENFILMPVGKSFYPVGIIVNYAHLGQSSYTSNLYLIQFEFGGKVPEADNQVFKPEEMMIDFIGVDLYQNLDTNDTKKIYLATVELKQEIRRLEKNATPSLFE